MLLSQRDLYEQKEDKKLNKSTTTRKKHTGDGHACDEPLRSVTNVTYGDGP